MERNYSRDIEGQIWLGLQTSCTESLIGGRIFGHTHYYFSTQDLDHVYSEQMRLELGFNMTSIL